MADLAKTLRIGVDELLYANITTSGAQATFAIPPQSSVYRANLVIQSAQLGGTVTTATFDVESAMDPEGPSGPSAFEKVNRVVPVSAAAATLSSYTGFTLIVATVGKAIAIDMSGYGGSGLIRLNFTTVTLGTGSGLAVFARIG
jgi:hypothetical protein